MSALVVAARFCRRQHALLLVDPPAGLAAAREDALEGMRDWPFQSADALMFFPADRTRMDRLHRRARDLRARRRRRRPDRARRRDAGGSLAQSRESALLRPSAQPRPSADESQREPPRALRRQRAGRDAQLSRARHSPLRTLAGEARRHPSGRISAQRRLALFVSASIERGTRWVASKATAQRSRERVAPPGRAFPARSSRRPARCAGSERNRHYFVLCDERLNGPVEAGRRRIPAASTATSRATATHAAESGWWCIGPAAARRAR